MDRCVDCGEVISICDHAVKRLLDPERSYSLGEIERLQRDQNEIREMVGAQDDETTVEAVRDMMTERKHYVRETNTAHEQTIPGLTAEIERLREALRRVYGFAAAIQRMTSFAPIGFRCSLIREVVSRALPDDEAKRLHDETDRLAPVIAWIRGHHVRDHDSDVVDVDHGPIVEWDYCEWCEDHGLPSDWPCMFVTALGETPK